MENLPYEEKLRLATNFETLQTLVMDSPNFDSSYSRLKKFSINPGTIWELENIASAFVKEKKETLDSYGKMAIESKKNWDSEIKTWPLTSLPTMFKLTSNFEVLHLAFIKIYESSIQLTAYEGEINAKLSMELDRLYKHPESIDNEVEIEIGNIKSSITAALGKINELTKRIEKRKVE